ncbi:MAG: alpha/beta hydrolase [Actinomycetota bacterium]|nr:alpha/beta hydrolase [Actinomycetota bacterium]
MPLDPQARSLLDDLAAGGGRPLAEVDLAEARELLAAGAALARQPSSPVSSQDRSIPGPGGTIPVRIYRPEATGTEPLPIVVYFHGGGFVLGGLDSHDPLCRQLAAGVPATVVSVDYRLAPEHPFPAAVDDATAATRWAADVAPSLGADPSRLVVAGDSAGGNLAAVVARRAARAGTPSVALQVLAYPVTDFTGSHPSHAENGEGYFLTTDDMVWFMQNYLPDGTDVHDPDISPLFAEDLSGLPPALVITAEFDPLRDEGEAYARRLADAGVPVELERYPGMIHGFVSMDGVLDAGARALDRIVASISQVTRT